MNKVKLKSNSGLVNKLGSLIALFVLCVILSFATSSFLTLANFMNIFKQTSVNALISTGMLIILAVLIDVTRERMEAKARRMAAK